MEIVNFNDIINEELDEAQKTLDAFRNDPKNIDSIYKAVRIIVDSFNNNGKVISCGNGGSHCDAMHFSEELSGRYRENRRALPAIAISDPSHITCTGNDFGFSKIFSRFIEGLGSKGDVLFGISTSGNSENIISAVSSAKEKGMKTILLLGNNGGKLRNTADAEIIVPFFGYADRIQEVHIKIIHIIILLIEKNLAIK
jgi:D-sedoheptulose 7-phosphate isomerase